MILFALVFGALVLTDKDVSPRSSADENSSLFPTDGRSQLPGDRASLSYTALPGQQEKVNVGYSGEGRPAWTGTMWGLVTPGERSLITIFEQRFEPSLSTELLEGALGAYNYEVARTAGKTVAYRTRKIDGRDAWVWRYRNVDGGRELQAWVVDRQYGHRLQCQVAADEAAVWRQCLAALENLKFAASS